MKSFISQLFILFSCLYTQETGTLNKDIDQYFNNFMDVYGVPGAALAIIKDDKIIFKKYYKTANIEFNVPVNINTLFQLSSLTKIFTATAIFQLIEKQQINLNENISAYIYELPANWQSIKVKHLLTHSSGLPEISFYDKFPEDSAKPLVYKDDILFKAGDKSRYTNTNFWLLQKIIENVTNHKLVDYVLKNQFSTCKKTAIYSGDFREIVSNRATSYEPDDNNFFRLRNYKFPQYLYGAAGLNLTLDCLIKWNEDLDNNILISEKNKFKMWSPYKLNNGELSPFSYGWHIRRPNNRSAIGFSGGYTTGMRKYLDDDLTIILLTNGYKNRYNIERVIEYLAGLVSENLS